MGFPGDSDGRVCTCNSGDLGSIPGLGRSPGGGHGNPLQYSCLENPHGQKSLASYSPWGHKELDPNEQLSTTQHMLIQSACISWFLGTQGPESLTDSSSAAMQSGSNAKRTQQLKKMIMFSVENMGENILL